MDHKYFTGRCSLDLHIENCQSLKEKRRVILSLKQRLRNRFNVAVCEYGDLSLWQRSQLGIVLCANEHKVVDSTLKILIGYLNRSPGISLVDFQIEII
jgi:uncharacterized protein YlxP (DUF503 family)